MERRAFIAAATGLAGAGFAGAGFGGAATAATPGDAAGNARHAGVIVRSYIAGVTAEALALVSAAKTGAQLRLVCEQDRRFDPRSVVVRTQGGQRLGYLPGRDARIIAPLIGQGLSLHARLVSTRHHPRPALHLDVVLET